MCTVMAASIGRAHAQDDSLSPTAAPYFGGLPHTQATQITPTQLGFRFGSGSPGFTISQRQGSLSPRERVLTDDQPTSATEELGAIRAAQFHMDIKPYRAVPLRITTGMIYNRLGATPLPRGFTPLYHDGLALQAEEVRAATGALDSQNFAPFAGVGFSHDFGRAVGRARRFSFSLDAGAMMQSVDDTPIRMIDTAAMDDTNTLRARALVTLAFTTRF